MKQENLLVIVVIHVVSQLVTFVYCSVSTCKPLSSSLTVCGPTTLYPRLSSWLTTTLGGSSVRYALLDLGGFSPQGGQDSTTTASFQSAD